MRIAVVTSYFPNSNLPTDGRYAYQTLRLLARRHEVQVFYPYAAYPSLLDGRRTRGAGFDPGFSVPDVNVAYYKYPAIPFLSRPLNGLVAAQALLPHVRNFAPDVILSYSLYPSGYAALKIAQALSVPVAAVAIGSDVYGIPDRFSRRHTGSVLREIDCLITVSDDLCRAALSIGARSNASRTIYGGCDLSVFKPGDRVEARNKLGIEANSDAIVYVGRLDIKKGLRELVNAAYLLKPLRPNLQVYIVGSGPDKSQIESAIRSNGAGNYVHLMPACSFNEVALWMTAADATTLPSYREGCPNTIMESLACGRPVVATNVGGIPEIMSDECGQLVAPRDAVALSRALGSVLDRTWNADQLSTQWGRGWEDCAEHLDNTCKWLISDSAHRNELWGCSYSECVPKG